MRYKLRPYQIRAVNRVRQHWMWNNRILLVSPTGSGKTVIASQIIENILNYNNSRRILFLAHRKEIISQTSKKLDEIGIEHGIIMGNNPRQNSHNVQVASIQTLLNRIKPEADIIFIDESHRTPASSYIEILEHYHDKKVLGLTATPWRIDDKCLGDVYQSIYVVSQVKNLVKEGFLMEPTVYIPYIPELTNVKMVGSDYESIALSKIMNTEILTDEIFKQWHGAMRDLKTVIFACSVEHSKSLVNKFSENGIKIGHIDHSTPEEERDTLLDKLRSGEIQILSNVSVLTEGWDLPELECLILARPTHSLTLYLQMVGRVMRTKEGKDKAIVLDFAGCTNQHGPVTLDRQFSLYSNAKLLPTKRACTWCGKIHNWIPTHCTHCFKPFLPEEMPPHLQNHARIKEYDAYRRKFTKCKKCGERVIDFNDTYSSEICLAKKCKTCNEIMWYANYGALRANITERRDEFNKMLEYALDMGLDKNWAIERYADVFGRPPTEDRIPYLGDTQKPCLDTLISDLPLSYKF